MTTAQLDHVATQCHKAAGFIDGIRENIVLLKHGTENVGKKSDLESYRQTLDQFSSSLELMADNFSQMARFVT